MALEATSTTPLLTGFPNISPRSSWSLSNSIESVTLSRQQLIFRFKFLPAINYAPFFMAVLWEVFVQVAKYPNHDTLDFIIILCLLGFGGLLLWTNVWYSRNWRAIYKRCVRIQSDDLVLALDMVQRELADVEAQLDRKYQWYGTIATNDPASEELIQERNILEFRCTKLEEKAAAAWWLVQDEMRGEDGQGQDLHTIGNKWGGRWSLVGDMSKMLQLP